MPADAGETLAEQIVAAVNVRNDVRQAHSAAAFPVRYASVLLQTVPGINREAAVRGCAAYRRCPSLRYEKTRTRPGRGSAPRAGGNRQEGEHGRAAFGRACFSRGFDDLTVLPGYCHAALDSSCRERLAA